MRCLVAYHLCTIITSWFILWRKIVQGETVIAWCAWFAESSAVFPLSAVVFVVFGR